MTRDAWIVAGISWVLALIFGAVTWISLIETREARLEAKAARAEAKRISEKAEQSAKERFEILMAQRHEQAPVFAQRALNQNLLWVHIPRTPETERAVYNFALSAAEAATITGLGNIPPILIDDEPRKSDEPYHGG